VAKKRNDGHALSHFTLEYQGQREALNLPWAGGILMLIRLMCYFDTNSLVIFMLGSLFDPIRKGAMKVIKTKKSCLWYEGIDRALWISK